jgi:beta-N-acetylhexosaminidase
MADHIVTTEDSGRLLMVGWEGNDPSEPISLLEKYRPTGLVFFRRNFPGSYEALKKDIREIHRAARKILRRNILMALDHEGGVVNRLPLDETLIPSHGELTYMARMSGLAKVEKVSRDIALVLKDLGFNFNLAPVADLAGAGDFMEKRSFGRDPKEASRVALAFWEGHRQAGLLNCAKHFPGLGSAREDPHEVLPVVDKPLSDLLEKDGMPFRTLIQRGLQAVMTTHALFVDADPDRPATFSEKIAGALKNDFEFKGPILTDDLEMGALNHVEGIEGPGDAAVKAVQSGHDLVLVCRREENVEEASLKIEEALVDGIISPTRFRQAILRVGRLVKLLA